MNEYGHLAIEDFQDGLQVSEKANGCINLGGQLSTETEPEHRFRMDSEILKLREITRMVYSMVTESRFTRVATEIKKILQRPIPVTLRLHACLITTCTSTNVSHNFELFCFRHVWHVSIVSTKFSVTTC